VLGWRWGPERLVTAVHHLLLARHGETDWNAAGRWQGHTDVPLNATGLAQARALAERVRGERLAAIVASDLARARATAAVVAAALGVELAQVDPDLRERRFGAFEGLTREECEERYPADWARFAEDPRRAPPGGEASSALLARVLPALHRAAERFGSPLLAVVHGGVMRAVLGHALHADTGAGRAPSIPAIPNGSVLRVGLAAGRVVEPAWLDPLHR
jgi:probable phosphoglycerate mutase